MSKAFEKNWFYRQVRQRHLFFAIESMFALLLSYYGAYWFSVWTHFSAPEIAGLWGAISSAIVITPVKQLSLKAGWFRFVGSIIGIVVSMIVLYLLGYGMLAFGLSIFVSVILCYLLPWDEAYHGALISVAVVVVVGHLLQATTSIWFNACSRLAESVIGIVITLMVVLLFHPLRKALNLTAEADSL